MGPLLVTSMNSINDSCVLDGSSVQWRQCDDLTDEWRERLQIGDTVLYRKRFIDRPQTAQITGKYQNGDECILEICFFSQQGVKRHNREFKTPTASRAVAKAADSFEGQMESSWQWCLLRQQAPLESVWPYFSDATRGKLVLQISLSLGSEMATVLRREPARPGDPICKREHLLTRIEQGLGWFSTPNPCSVCGRTSGNAKGCDQCKFEVCARCLHEGCQMQGGGVFCDMLSPPLAKDLVRHPGWLKFKAEQYFIKADWNENGACSDDEIEKIIVRLRAVLGLETLTSSLLRMEVQKYKDMQSSTQPRNFEELRLCNKGLTLQTFHRMFQSILQASASQRGQDAQLPFEDLLAGRPKDTMRAL